MYQRTPTSQKSILMVMLVAKATSYMFATKTLQNEVLRIYRTSVTFIPSKNIRIIGVDPADHEIL
jgi:hypothetical protein